VTYEPWSIDNVPVTWAEVDKVRVVVVSVLVPLKIMVHVHTVPGVKYKGSGWLYGDTL